MPSLSDVRRVVTEFAILPLGEQHHHRISAAQRRTNEKLIASLMNCLLSWPARCLSLPCCAGRFPSGPRESPADQIHLDCGPARRGQEDAGSLHLHRDWGELVWPDRCQHRGQVPGQGGARHDDAHGFQGESRAEFRALARSTRCFEHTLPKRASLLENTDSVTTLGVAFAFVSPGCTTAPAVRSFYRRRREDFCKESSQRRQGSGRGLYPVMPTGIVAVFCLAEMTLQFN